MRTGWLSLVGIVLVLPLLVGSLRGSVTLEATAIRVAVLVVALAVVDRVVVPVGRLLLALLRPASDADDPETADPAVDGMPA